MNRIWMRQRLQSFKELCDQYQRLRDGGLQFESRLDELEDEMTLRIPTIKEIVKRLEPSLVQEVTLPDELIGALRSRHTAQTALGILQDQEEWAANLAPDAPSLVADHLHPHVWNAVAGLWETGRYRVAVSQAATALSTHIASKAGSPLAERKLVSQVFSPSEPTRGQARLHMPGDKRSETWRSKQEGLLLIAQGAFAGIRNVAVHTDDEWSEDVAMEHLAVLSVVARWVDETDVVTPSASPGDGDSS